MTQLEVHIEEDGKGEYWVSLKHGKAFMRLTIGMLLTCSETAAKKVKEHIDAKATSKGLKN